MRLGAQVSVSGGLFNAFKNAHDIGADSLMFYTRSNRQWTAKPILDEDITRYTQAAAEYSKIFPVVIHANYLMNLASPEADKWDMSYTALIDEIQRTGQIACGMMVLHPGSHMGSGEAVGIEKIAAGLRRALDETAETAPDVTICLEVMAGQGTNLGYKFEHLADIIEKAGGDERLGVCFDTCHVFAAGYDIRTPESYAQTMAEFDRLIGLERIKCFHFNDSKYDLGTRRDRHEHIGRGYLGAAAFANFVNDPRWADHPAHLETPKTEDQDDGTTLDMDPENLTALRQLLSSQA